MRENSVGKAHDELQEYNGLVDCIGKAAADRLAKLYFMDADTARSIQ